MTMLLIQYAMEVMSELFIDFNRNVTSLYMRVSYTSDNLNA
jgi:hypothetical protein